MSVPAFDHVMELKDVWCTWACCRLLLGWVGAGGCQVLGQRTLAHPRLVQLQRVHKACCSSAQTDMSGILLEAANDGYLLPQCKVPSTFQARNSKPLPEVSLRWRLRPLSGLPARGCCFCDLRRAKKPPQPLPAWPGAFKLAAGLSPDGRLLRGSLSSSPVTCIL